MWNWNYLSTNSDKLEVLIENKWKKISSVNTTLGAHLSVNNIHREKMSTTTGYSFVSLAPLRSVSCNFEHPYLCGYTFLNFTNYKWRNHQGYTPTPQTGPTVDHTYGNATGLLHCIICNCFRTVLYELLLMKQISTTFGFQHKVPTLRSQFTRRYFKVTSLEKNFPCSQFTAFDFQTMS